MSYRFQKTSISSNVLPLVSGTRYQTKIKATTHINAKSQKVAVSLMRSIKTGKVKIETNVAAQRTAVVTDMALPRMRVGKISEARTQKPGPKPSIKKLR